MDLDAIALFAELADRTASEREEYYSQHQVPAAVRAQVEALLQFDDRAIDSFAGHVASAAVRAMFANPPPQDPTPAGATSSRHPVAIARYQVIRILGRGGMSEVYLARDPLLERDVAVKLIAGELDDDAARKRVVREARAAGRLRHPNIVTIFDAGEHDGRPYIAMEYVPGETLRSIIQRQATLPLHRRLELIEGACAGLAHAHRAEVVHLDVKPDNLMLDEAGIVKVLDFGIARVLKGEAYSTRHVVGTLRYMSPEQIAGNPLDRRSDVFSLGSSLFELLTYMPAYAGSTQEIVTRIACGPVPRLLDAIPGIDPRLDAILSRAMALEPSDRFDDLEELRVDLARLRAEMDPADERLFAQPVSRLSVNAVATPAPVTPEASSQRRTSTWLWRSRLTTSIAAAVVLATGGWMFWTWPVRTPPDAPRAVTEPIHTPAPSEPVRPTQSSLPHATSASDEVLRRLPRDDRKGELDQSRPVSEGQPVPPATTVQPQTSAESAVITAPPDPPAPSPAVESPPPDAVSPPAVETAALERAARADPKTPQTPSEAEEVLLTLRRWEAAFKALDVSRVTQVFLSLGRDQREEVRKTFSGMRVYEVEIRNPRVEVQVDLATVHAIVARRMTRVEGRTVANQVATEFRLRRVNDVWLITEVIPRGKVEEADQVKN